MDERLAVVSALLLVVSLGIGATRSESSSSSPGLSATPQHIKLGRRSSSSEGEPVDYGLLLMPLASMLRRKTDIEVEEPFIAASEHEHRRDELGIIVDVLTIAELPTSKKAIRHYARLNLDQANRYTSFLVKRGLMEVRYEGSRRLVTTKRGHDLLALLHQSE